MSVPPSLLPYSHNDSRKDGEIALATTRTRKRDYPTSESNLENDTSTDIDSDSLAHPGKNAYKRMQLSSDFMDEDLLSFTLPSSPPKPEFSSQTSMAGASSAQRMNSARSDITLVRQPARLASAITSRSSSFNVSNDSLEDLAAIEVIQNIIDEGLDVLDLDSRGLTCIPSKVRDLKNHVGVSFGMNDGPLSTSMKIYLSNNSISVLPPPLFEVDNLTVLSLRNNKLKEIPNAIYRLRNLEDFSVGGNELEYLPAQLRLLNRLNVLTTHPNPFMQVPVEYSQESVSKVDKILHVSEPVLVSNSAIRRLSEECLRVIARYRASDKEIAKWELHENHQRKISDAVEALAYQNTCGQCALFMVYPVAHAFEWWILSQSVHASEVVVLKREFCSMNCIMKWHETVVANVLHA